VSDDSVYCFCTKFGRLIPRKVIKTVATRCQILRIKCTKIQNSAGAPPQTPLGELTALHRPLAGFKGPNSTGVGKGREGMGGSGKGGEGTGVQKIVKIDPGSETVGLRTRPVWDQNNRSWSWSCRFCVVLWNTILSRTEQNRTLLPQAITYGRLPE